MIVVSGSANKPFAEELAERIDADYVETKIEHFPDGELHITVPKCAREAIVVQSMAFRPNEYFMELLFICDALRRDGCKKIIAVIPYLAYARQDMEFHKGEEVSFQAVSHLMEIYCDSLITVDAHLHRIKNIKFIASKAKNTSAMPIIGEYLKEKYNLNKPVVIGPDEESEQWAKQIAEVLSCDYDVFKKTRHSATKVEIKPKERDLNGRDVVVIDDIVSTGGTMAQAVEIAKKEGAEKVLSVCTHGLFVDDALRKITRAGADEVLSTNTVQNKTAKIDVVGAVADILNNRLKLP